MEFKLLHVYVLFSLALVGSHAVTPEVYWKSVLPNTPIPKAIKDLLYSKAWDDGLEKVSTSTASNDEVEDDLKKVPSVSSKDAVEDGLENTAFFYVAPKDEVKDDLENTAFFYVAPKNEVKDDLKKVPSVLSKDAVEDGLENTAFFYVAPKDEVKDDLKKVPSVSSKDAVEDGLENTAFFYVAPKDEVKDGLENTAFFYVAPKDEVKGHPRKLPIFNGSCKDKVKHHHHYDASHNHQKDNSLAKPFLEKDLHEGKEFKLYFMKNDQKTAFLPKNISDSIPFSSKNLPEIYNKFSVKHDSMEAKMMKQTIDICEHKGVEGEEIFCATSLESMVDFTTTKLGKRVKALSTEVYTKEPTPSQNYKIESVKKLIANKLVVCHRLNYTYAVFYCHISVGTESYVASLEGADGTKVKIVVICHTETSKWDPKHITFQLLNVTPGSATICHFLPEDHVLWVRSSKNDTLYM
ncbi:BURP domain protein RD22 isoform X9 [Helianthus annuus]|uniref:BURP domain protein RD22 isoform X8 n=1 Tax=Helianthus annuus TaxID=4232 RepID=UPI001652FC82|nr:BURP domain protein RD22 isoform X8 [Helianthus annuus]XP_035831932.1 BURP domain protein RD22 isoform X9 [Helianthus annuus]